MAENPFVLSAAEAARIVADAEGIIDAADTTADLMRLTVEGEDEFGGPRLVEPTVIAVIRIEFVQDSLSEVLEPDVPGMVKAKIGSGVKKNDKLRFLWHDGEEHEHVVRNVKTQVISGVPVYLKLDLEPEYGEHDEDVEPEEP